MFLVTTDLHLSDRPRDEYRFGLFKWMAKQQQTYGVQATFILGDITHDKDRHSSALVNRIVDELTKLAPPVYILRGNHDGINPNDPFFRFLNQIEGLRFVVRPRVIKALNVAMIPHCRDQSEFDAACGSITPKSAAVMLHNTFEGAIAENGARLSGLRASPAAFKGAMGVWAGDVHKPQQAGPVTYVGSPYHVKFGDCFKPRVLLVKQPEEGPCKDLIFDCPRKWLLTVHDADEISNNHNLRKGDQVKVTIQLYKEEIVEWAAHKKRALAVCEELKLEVFGCECEVVGATKKAEAKPQSAGKSSTESLIEDFCKREKASSQIREAGLLIAKE